MNVAKRFRWEAAHRLPWHDGPCDNLNGHSYRMTVELEGTPDERGMLIDFQDVKRILMPLVDAWDHATLVAETDDELLHLVQQTDWKCVVLPCDTTAENLAAYASATSKSFAYASPKPRPATTRRVPPASSSTETSEREAARSSA